VSAAALVNTGGRGQERLPNLAALDQFFRAYGWTGQREHDEAELQSVRAGPASRSGQAPPADSGRPPAPTAPRALEVPAGLGEGAGAPSRQRPHRLPGRASQWVASSAAATAGEVAAGSGRSASARGRWQRAAGPAHRAAGQRRRPPGAARGETGSRPRRRGHQELVRDRQLRRTLELLVVQTSHSSRSSWVTS
jgi:hypothetical protein